MKKSASFFEFTMTKLVITAEEWSSHFIKVFLALNLNLIHVFTPKGKRPLKINSSTLFIKYSGSELMLPYS